MRNIVDGKHHIPSTQAYATEQTVLPSAVKRKGQHSKRLLELPLTPALPPEVVWHDGGDWRGHECRLLARHAGEARRCRLWEVLAAEVARVPTGLEVDQSKAHSKVARSADVLLAFGDEEACRREQVRPCMRQRNRSQRLHSYCEPTCSLAWAHASARISSHRSARVAPRGNAHAGRASFVIAPHAFQGAVDVATLRAVASPALALEKKERKTYACLQACVKGAVIKEDHRGPPWSRLPWPFPTLFL
jgi:hypothetical protein